MKHDFSMHQLLVLSDHQLYFLLAKDIWMSVLPGNRVEACKTHYCGVDVEKYIDILFHISGFEINFLCCSCGNCVICTIAC